MMRVLPLLAPNNRTRCRYVRLSALFATMFVLTGCGSLKTSYQRPAIDMPEQFAQKSDSSAPSAATISRERWWDLFGDPQLSAMIDDALLRNNELAVATIKVRRAQLTAGIAADNRSPQFATGISSGVSRNLSGNRGNTRNNSVQVSASYEIDLWRRLDSLQNSAQWEELATQQDRESTRLSLIATTANLYWNAAYLKQSIARAHESIAYAEKTLKLVQVQYDAGAVAALELLEAKQNVATQQAGLAQLRQQKVVNDNALAILFDGPPRALPYLPAELQEGPLPTLAPGIPAEVLARRPDLRAAELRLRGTLANQHATRASFYPKFSLNGSLGTGSARLLEILQNPVGSLGLSLALPFLQWQQMQLANKVAQADHDIAVVNFRQVLYTALGEVENALSARAHYAAQTRLLSASLDAARRAEQLYEIRYRSGSVALSDFLNAQDKRRSAEIQLTANQREALNGEMTLYKALGGPA